MKKLLAALMVLLMLLPLAACGAGQTESESEKKIKIVTTVFPPYDFAREIASEHAEITMLLPPGSEAHFFEPTVSDIAKINGCDLFIAAGGSLDSWIDNTLSVCENDITVLRMTDCVSLFREEIAEGMEEEEEESGADDGYDEHVWTSPKNAVAIVKAICASLVSLDPENASDYQKNTDEYVKKLEALDEGFRECVARGKRREIVFAERFPFRYLAEEYGLTYYAAFAGCSSQSEPKLQTIAFLVNKIKEDGIPVVFYIEFSTQSVADTICAETGAKKLLFHSCHNVSVEDFNAGATYLGLMEQNLANLGEALG